MIASAGSSGAGLKLSPFSQSSGIVLVRNLDPFLDDEDLVLPYLLLLPLLPVRRTELARVGIGPPLLLRACCDDDDEEDDDAPPFPLAGA
jgi:hypothetical protein